MYLKEVKVGDELTRILGAFSIHPDIFFEYNESLGNPISLQVMVGYATDKIIKVGSKDGIIPWQDGWTFNRENGAEIDEDLGWDGITKTGSFIKLNNGKS